MSHRTRATVDFLIDKTKLLDRLRDELNERQLTVLLRVLQEVARSEPSGYVRYAVL